MRAFTLISGLFLTSAVFAAPIPSPQEDVNDANPFNTGIEKRLDIPVNVPTVAIPAVPGVPAVPAVPAVPSIPKVSLDTITKDLPVKTPDLSAVTSKTSPALKAASPMLSSVLTSLTSADTSVKSLMTNTQSNTATLVATIQGHINSATSKMQSAMKILGVDTSGLLAVTSLVGQCEVMATQLVADLEKVDAAVPGVADLVGDAKALVAMVQGLGL